LLLAIGLFLARQRYKRGDEMADKDSGGQSGGGGSGSGKR
jgi:hypothetical protein